jgi:pyridoxal phosphate-dependent aminotransferase EpsN
MKRIYLSPPHMSGKELDYIKEAFEENWIAPVGPALTKFENMVAEYVGSKYAIAVTSGTAGIHLALRALGVGEGDYVICSSLTFAGTVNPIKYLGANPVYIDSDPLYWNMDPTLLETAILNLPEKPKAIIPVHIFGVPCDMYQISKIAESYDIPIIEDAAESLGSTFNGKHTGTFGKIGIYSFNGNKLLTTSGGGMIVTDDKEMADYMNFLSTQAKDPAPYYWHTDIGYNYRLSNILAAIGVGQIEVIEDRITATRNVNEIYQKELSDLFLGFQLERSTDRSNCWLTCVFLKPNDDPQDLIAHLEKANIESRRIWCPMHLQPAYNPARKYINGTSEILFDRGVCLPSGSSMSNDDIDRVVTEIKKFFNK